MADRSARQVRRAICTRKSAAGDLADDQNCLEVRRDIMPPTAEVMGRTLLFPTYNLFGYHRDEGVAR